MTYKIRLKISVIAYVSFFCACMLSAQQNQEAKLLRFKFNKGDKSRILSTVNEDVFVNGTLNHRAEILNRISCSVTDTDQDGNGTSEALFMTTENSTAGKSGQSFSWGDEYKSIFKRSTTGKYEIEDIYFMPVVRDVPVFPETPVKPGDKWTEEGHEAHDLRRTFGIEKPFKVPFTANYQYIRDETDEKSGRTLCVLDIKYNLYYESPADSAYRKSEDAMNAPAVTMGYSHQTVWWDNDKGMIDHYKENFRIIMETYFGDVITFRGTAHAEVTDFDRLNTEENARKITDAVKSLDLQNVAVTQGEKGLTISLENIQFKPDSSELTENEKNKLRYIADILRNFDNDLLITGHCALRGTKQSQQQISEERAQAVAGYLEFLKVRDPHRIFTQGKGAEQPAADNSTEAGRARNRRVEITVMDE